MFEQVTSQYIRFIKQFMVQQLYSKFIKITYGRNNYDTDTLLMEITNESIWNEIFTHENIMIKYYQLLLSQFPEENTWNEVTVFHPETFQEYIDSRVNIHSVSTREYQQFVKNMEHENFRSNMVEKYTELQETRRVKNHLIYNVNLYVRKTINPNMYMTDQEESEVDGFLDMRAYFEYMRNNNWLDYNDCISNENVHYIEALAVQKVHKSIYG